MTGAWWQRGIIYQVYPRSFADADGDGVGDLPGLTARLDYLASLGVDAVWLSPMYPSPMADFGYDVADYCDVDPLFGTLDDFDRLVAAAGERDIRIILDLVPNHSSDEHPWFEESRSSRENPKRDWYIWRDPAPGGGPPNNWGAHFGGSAWELDERTGQYYLHLFDVKQPDLDWRNPEVRTAIYDAMRFWFARGVAGLRIDVLWMLLKDPEYPDEPPPPPLAEGESEWSRNDHPYYEDLPEMEEIVREMRAVADEFSERVLIGELYLPLDRLVRYYGEQLDGIQMPFNFGLIRLAAWDATALRELVDAYEAALPSGAWPNWVLGNHDIPRIAGRAGPGGVRLAQMLLLTLRGTPTLYYGDELGMADVEVPPEQIVDPQAEAGRSRDPIRSPMPWDGGPNAGFSAPSARPWLPLGPDVAERNVAVQSADPRSELSLVRRLIALRRARPALTAGSYASVVTPHPELFAYLRETGDERVLVVLHLGGEPLVADLSSGVGSATAEALCSTGLDRDGAVDLAALSLAPREGVVLAVAA